MAILRIKDKNGNVIELPFIADLRPARTLVLENPDPRTAMSAGGFDWPYQQYSGIEVEYRVSVDESELINSGFIPVDTSAQVWHRTIGPDTENGCWGFRQCAAGEQIEFSSGYLFSGTDPSDIAIDNTLMIPYRVYGVK